MARGVDPTAAGDALKALLDTWDAAAERMLAAVARRLAQGIEQDGWAEVKARQVLSVRDELRTILARLDATVPEQAARALDEAYKLGWQVVASRDLPVAIGTRPGLVQQLIEWLVGQLGGMFLPVLRAQTDLFQVAIGQTEALMATGTITRRDAVAQVVDRLLAAGHDRFQDRAGRRWHLDSYARMAGRTAAQQAAVEGGLAELQAEGVDIVQLSDSPRECSLCRPWERELLSITGRSVGTEVDGKRVTATIAEARAAGVWHPNCTHRADEVIPGLTDVHRPAKHNPDGYEEQQRLRQLERKARELKRRLAAAQAFGDTTTARALRQKVKANSAAIKQHAVETGQNRRGDRERPVDGGKSLRRTPAAGQSSSRPSTAVGPQAPTVGLPAGEERRLAHERAENQLPPLRKATAEDLDARLTRATEAEDYERLDAIVAEMERREQVAARRAERERAHEEERWAQLDALINQGHSEEEAVAEVFGRSVERQRRDRAITELRSQGYTGKGFDELARRSFRDFVYGRYIEAENVTRGQLLTPEARAAGIDPHSLFVGPAARARAHASDELKAWWDLNGRVTLEQYKVDLLGDTTGSLRAQFRTGGEDWLR
ncbi:hypothetical protein JOF56_011625 [Kibdelosporangium banguiense]|uniref:Phage minor capsid protein 2 n=1 Tax=Kibdelosporangium banguiense TaxID=1365924 RepID=A0ABS4U3N9_9PSEU|nr:phage minor capsid protein [Kibdelosporangium banguiense]MBP2331240.1 hypothetical protein [Kibdelosporangium banguiense]